MLCHLERCSLKGASNSLNHFKYTKVINPRRRALLLCLPLANYFFAPKTLPRSSIARCKDVSINLALIDWIDSSMFVVFLGFSFVNPTLETEQSPLLTEERKTTKPLHAFFNSFPLLEVFCVLIRKKEREINFFNAHRNLCNFGCS